ncbi:hypothetical protein Pint_06110 [Pistacia integerrima]|uniref:Uncharacterized protein n=1 Tax=Pistacia integerrima TaxID=434235 RepID=A0ACC0Z762_9ROSI|nr:hypothetical protein Pint_06110 [Pistacia integerrima]
MISLMHRILSAISVIETALHKVIRDNRFVNQHAKTNSMRNSSVLANISKSIKPSSLRMPSPKIGYFDAQYSVALTPKGDMRFHSGVHSSSSKTGSGVANHNGVATRTMRGKLQQWGTLSEIDSQKTGGLCHPLGNRLCGSASSKKDKVNRGFMNLKKGMKRKGLDSQRTAKNEDANKQSPLHILTDDDKENLWSFHNQVENLSKHIEAINFN